MHLIRKASERRPRRIGGRAGARSSNGSTPPSRSPSPASDRASSGDGQPPAQCRAVRTGAGADGPPDDPGDRATSTEPCLDEVEVYTAADPGGRAPTQRCRGAAGGTASASSEYPDNPHPQDRSSERRPDRQQPELDLAACRARERSRSRGRKPSDDRPRRLGPRPRGGLSATAWRPSITSRSALEPGRWQVVASSLDRAKYIPADHRRACSGRRSQSARRAARSCSNRQAELRSRLAQLGTTMKVYAGTFSQPGPTHLLVRGDPTQKGAGVAPAAIACSSPHSCSTSDTPEASAARRAGAWIADPANPLPARVMVNRVWHYHFGRGIVATPSDFGFNGAPPSHPELLDWLAVGLHRRRLAAQADPSADRHLGGLSPVEPARPEGPGDRSRQPPALADDSAPARGRVDPRRDPGDQRPARSRGWAARDTTSGRRTPITLPSTSPAPSSGGTNSGGWSTSSSRGASPTRLSAPLTAPTRRLSVPRRNVSTTALQALNLLNSPFVIRQADLFRRTPGAEAGPEPGPGRARRFAWPSAARPTDRAAMPPSR